MNQFKTHYVNTVIQKYAQYAQCATICQYSDELTTVLDEVYNCFGGDNYIQNNSL